MEEGNELHSRVCACHLCIEKPRAYTITDDVFGKGFFRENKDRLRRMKNGEIIEVPGKSIQSWTEIYGIPWNINYIGRIYWDKGPKFVFMDEHMNKIYEYHDTTI